MADTTPPLQIPVAVTGEAAAVQGLVRVQGAVTNLARGVEGMAQRFQQSFAGITAGIGALTAFFGAQGVRASLAAWRETSTSMRELEFQLRRSGKAAAETTTELNALADALEESTGVDDAKVRTVMRILLAQGNQIDQVKQLTPLILDLASAMETDAVSAARMIGAQLEEGNISIKRLGVSAKTTEDLIFQLTTRIQGQAAASFSAQGSAGRLAVAIGNAKEEVGALVEVPIFAFLTGFVDGVKKATASISEWKRNNEALYASLTSTVGTVGNVIGGNLDKILLVTGALVALRGSMALLNGVANTLFGTTFATAAASWLSNVKGVQALSGEVGILRAATVGLVGVLSTVAAAGATAFAGWELGKVISDLRVAGDTVQNGIVRTILQAKVAWLEFKDSIGFGSSEARSEIALLREEIEKTNVTQQEADALQDRALEARQARTASSQATGGSGDTGSPAKAANEALLRGKGLLAVEEEQLRRGQELLRADYEAKRVTLDQFAQYRMEQVETLYQQEVIRLHQVAAESEDKARAQIELEEALKLAHERYVSELLRLDTDLARERDQLRREELRKELELKRSVLEEQRGAITEKRARDQRSFRLGREEKRALEIGSLRQEDQVIGESIRGLESQRDAEKDPAARAEIEGGIRGLQSERRGVRGQLAAAEETPDPNSMADQFDATLTKATDSLNTFAEGVADVFGSVIQGAVDGIAESIEGLIKGTMDWGDALRNIGSTIMNSVVTAIARMFAEWLVKRALMAAKNILFSQQEGAADTAAKAPGALMSSISSYGVAAIVGIAALMAALAALSGGFAEGGYTGNGPVRAPAGVVHGKEFVMNANAVSKYGLPLLSSMNAQAAGVWEVGTGVNNAAVSRGMSRADESAQPTTASSKRQVNVVVVDDRNAARDYLATAEGEAMIVKMMRKNAVQVGIPT